MTRHPLRSKGLPAPSAAATIIDSNGAHDAQAIAQVEGPDGPLIVKCYGKKRSLLRQACVQVGHWTFAGKSGCAADARRRNELTCLELWRDHGFDVFRPMETSSRHGRAPQHHESVELCAVSNGRPSILLEAVPGDRLYDLLLHAKTDAEETRVHRHLASFAREWSRRHREAIQHREPRLLHEHGTFRHVWVAGERLITFDFEISWVRRAYVRALAGREIAAFLRSLGRASEIPGTFRPRLATVVRNYDDRDQLERLVRGQLTPLRQWIARVFTPRRRRADPFRRERIMRTVRDLLDERDEPARGTTA